MRTDRRSIRAVRFAVLAAVAGTVFVLPAPSEGAPHGCVSATNSYWVTGDVARRSVGLQVHSGKPCSF